MPIQRTAYAPPAYTPYVPQYSAQDARARLTAQYQAATHTTAASERSIAAQLPELQHRFDIEEAGQPVVNKRGGCGFAKGCLLAAAALTLAGGVGVGGWRLAIYLKDHKVGAPAANHTASAINVTDNSFGPMVGANPTVILPGSTNNTAPNPTNTSHTNTTTGATYQPPVPCAVSFVGTGGGNLTDCVATPLQAATNPYIEPQAVSGAVYQPIDLTPLTLYPTGGVPNLYDVVEHHMNVCYEAAAIAAIAARIGGTLPITQAIVQTSAGKVPTFNISMFSPGPNRTPLNISISGLQMVRSNAQVLETSGTHDLYSVDPKGNWATMFEKAFTKYNDVFRPGSIGRRGAGKMGYNGIGEGGNPSDVLEAFTGRPTGFFDIASNATLDPHALGVFFQEKRGDNNAVNLLTSTAANFTAGTDAASLRSKPMICSTIPTHTYVTLDIDTAQDLATIHNVWGTNPCFDNKGKSIWTTNGTVVMSMQDVKNLFVQSAFTYSPASPALRP